MANLVDIFRVYTLDEKKMKDQIEEPIIIEDSSSSHNRSAHHHNPHVNLWWAFILIFAGIVFLLNNFGIIPWNVWRDLWKLWPVFLIFWGIQILFGGGKIINFLITIIVISILTFVLLSLLSPNNPSLIFPLRLSLPK